VGWTVLLDADDKISNIDLALDLWVAFDGRQTVLDEDEFANHDLATETCQQVWSALNELQMLFVEKRTPGSIIRDRGPEG
jgi:protein associated with RNAse G/E